MGYMEAMIAAAKISRESRRRRLLIVRMKRRATRLVSEIPVDALIDDRFIYFN